MYYTYVLQSQNDLKFYFGFTKDLKQRFEQGTCQNLFNGVNLRLNKEPLRTLRLCGEKKYPVNPV
jgi:predicted GIY-YIG superfamily endonuclease